MLRWKLTTNNLFISHYDHGAMVQEYLTMIFFSFYYRERNGSSSFLFVVILFWCVINQLPWLLSIISSHPLLWRSSLAAAKVCQSSSHAIFHTTEQSRLYFKPNINEANNLITRFRELRRFLRPKKSLKLDFLSR